MVRLFVSISVHSWLNLLLGNGETDLDRRVPVPWITSRPVRPRRDLVNQRLLVPTVLVASVRVPVVTVLVATAW